MLPIRVIKLHKGRPLILSYSLRTISKIFRSMGKVGLHRGSIAQMESPVVVQRNNLSLSTGTDHTQAQTYDTKKLFHLSINKTSGPSSAISHRWWRLRHIAGNKPYNPPTPADGVVWRGAP